MENILFKQSFRGFDRQQVLEYIDNLSNEMSQQAENYTKIQQELECEIQVLSDKLSENSDKLNVSQGMISELSKDLDQLKKNNVDLKSQINTYRNMILERDREISNIKTSYNKLTEHKETLEQENKDWKSKQDEIAACMVEASVRAKQIISDAEHQAQQTKNELNENAVHLMDKVTDMKSEIVRLEEQLESSFSKLSTALDNMEKAGNVIENQIKDYQERVETLDVVKISEDITESEEKSNVTVQKSNCLENKKSLTETVLDTISKLLEK